MSDSDSKHDEWSEVGDLLGELYRIVKRLEEMFPGRKFTPDGHLVGSIGEALAKHMFDLCLLPASAPGHDATTSDGRTHVQVKLTQGKTINLSAEPDHLLVLRLTQDLIVEIIYNGSGKAPWGATGKRQRNGQCPISISKLRKLDEAVLESDRLPLRNKVELHR